MRPEGSHLFAIGAEDAGDCASGEAAKNRQLPTMVNHVEEHHRPEQFADGQFLPGEVAHLAVEVGILEFANALQRVGVDPLVAGSARNRSRVNGSSVSLSLTA